MGGDKTWHCTSLLANDMPVYLLSKSTTASSTQSKSIRTLSSFDKLCLPANIQIADTIPNNLQHLPSLVGWMVSHSHFQISTLSVSLDTHGVLVDHRMQYPASKLWEVIQSGFNWLWLLLLYVCYSQDIVSDKKKHLFAQEKGNLSHHPPIILGNKIMICKTSNVISSLLQCLTFVGGQVEFVIITSYVSVYVNLCVCEFACLCIF